MTDKPIGAILTFSEFLDTFSPPPKRYDLPIMLDETPVKVRGDALGAILWRGKQWAVTEDGIEKLDGCYFIGAERILEDLPTHSWLQHMGEKSWSDTEEFATAWLVAIVLLRDRIPKGQLPQADNTKGIRNALRLSPPPRKEVTT